VGIFKGLDAAKKVSLKVGDKVSAGDAVCVVEAMKLINEIESEFSGEIVEILVQEGDTVEFGQKLFAIK
jgi:acetyl-CoA carboxylase biotin carboxyl carrier protein